MNLALFQFLDRLLFLMGKVMGISRGVLSFSGNVPFDKLNDSVGLS